MRVRVPIALWLILILLLVALLPIIASGCRPSQAPDERTVPGTPDAREVGPPLQAAPLQDHTSLPDRQGLTPEQVTQTYYEWYIAMTLARFEGLSDLDPVLQAEGYLHDSMVQSIVAEREAGLMADPMLCAQDVPRSVRVIEGEREGPQANVLLGTSFEGHRLAVFLKEDAMGWQISQVQCHPEQASAAPQATPLPLAPAEPGWVEYQNQEYGFAVLVPEDWGFQVLAQDPHMPPIGPPSLKLAVYMAPREPESTASTPFSIEFAIGDEQELAAIYGEATSSEPMEIGGLPAMREVESLGEDVALIRYVIHHPRFPERRVILLDPISGFAERRAQASETLVQFDRVVNSFRFVD